APDSNPGYDALVQAENSGRIYRVSLKHHGTSSHEVAFRTACRSLENDFLAKARAAKLTDVRITITGSQPWQSSQSSTWKQLSELFNSDALALAFAYVLTNELAVAVPTSVKLSNWSVQLSRLPTPGLATSRVSYVMQVMTPHHRNEYQNLEYKLEDACAN